MYVTELLIIFSLFSLSTLIHVRKFFLKTVSSNKRLKSIIVIPSIEFKIIDNLFIIIEGPFRAQPLVV